MTLVLQVIALIGLIMFIVFALLWLIAVNRRPNNAALAVVGAVIWAIPTAILMIMALF